MSPVLSNALMVPLMSIVNFLIPSGSGQAAVITPILAPIGEIGCKIGLGKLVCRMVIQ